MAIRHVLLDYDGVFTLDDYSAVSEELSASSGIRHSEIEGRLGDIERKYVLTMDPRRNFLKEVAAEFHFKGSLEYLEELLNRRGDTGLFKELPKFKKAGLALSILSNQIAYRLPHVREEIKRGAAAIGGITGFERVYFSPEIGLQKPFVGVSEADAKSGMDTSGIDAHVVKFDRGNPSNTVYRQIEYALKIKHEIILE